MHFVQQVLTATPGAVGATRGPWVWLGHYRVRSIYVKFTGAVQAADKITVRGYPGFSPTASTPPADGAGLTLRADITADGWYDISTPYCGWVQVERAAGGTVGVTVDVFLEALRNSQE